MPWRSICTTAWRCWAWRLPEKNVTAAVLDERRSARMEKTERDVREMEIRQVWAVYWSATGNSRTVAEAIAGTLAEKLNCLLRVRDITRPENRAESLNFAPGDLAVIALPIRMGPSLR